MQIFTDVLREGKQEAEAEDQIDAGAALESLVRKARNQNLTHHKEGIHPLIKVFCKGSAADVAAALRGLAQSIRKQGLQGLIREERGTQLLKFQNDTVATKEHLAQPQARAAAALENAARAAAALEN